MRIILVPAVAVSLIQGLVTLSNASAQAPGADAPPNGNGAGGAGQYAQQVRDANPGPARMAIVGGSEEAAKKYSKIPDDSVASLPQHVPFVNEQMKTGQEGTQSETRNKSIGTNQSTSVAVSLAPLMESRLMNQSKEVMGMYKDLITAPIPVMGQTFFMVENGAATGYFQALNTTANLTNQITTSTLAQLELLKQGDPSGARNYVSSILNRYNRQEGDNKSVLAAMVHASGDTLKSEPVQAANDPYQAVPDNPEPHDMQGEKDPIAAAPLEKAMLTEILFDFSGKNGQTGGSGQPGQSGGSGTRSNDYSDTEREKLKKEFQRMLGDLEIEYRRNAQTDLVRTVQTVYKAPEKGGTTANGDTEISGPSLAQLEETGVAWEAFHRLLKGACEFVKTNQTNYSDSDNRTKIGKRELLVTTTNLKNEDFENASAPDIPMNMNLLNNALQIFSTHRDIKNMDCSEIDPDVQKMPKKLDDLNKDKVDDCKENTGCLRSRLFYYIAYTIGRSRALHRYQVLYLLSMRHATAPWQREYVDQIFDHAFGGLNLYQELEANRERWAAAMQFLGRRANAKSGGGNSLGAASENSSYAGAQGKS